MKIKTNPVGAAINQYMMKAALPFGGYFIVEYLIRIHSGLNNIPFSLLAFAMSLGTVIVLYYVVKQIRDKILEGKIQGFMAWTFGTQFMLFAGLVEATFIYIYNQFLVPTNLATIQNETIAQLTLLQSQFNSLPNQSELTASMANTIQQNIDMLQESPVPSAIEAAMSTLSTDIFAAMILMLIIAPILRKK